MQSHKQTELQALDFDRVSHSLILWCNPSIKFNMKSTLNFSVFKNDELTVSFCPWNGIECILITSHIIMRWLIVSLTFVAILFKTTAKNMKNPVPVIKIGNWIEQIKSVENKYGRLKSGTVCLQIDWSNGNRPCAISRICLRFSIDSVSSRISNCSSVEFLPLFIR